MKSDLELNQMAETLFEALAKNWEPLEVITIIGITLLMFYERAVWEQRPTIEKFSSDIHNGLLDTWKARTMTAPSTETKQ